MASPSVVEAKIGDLPRYREQLLAAIRANPGKKAKLLAPIMLHDYAVSRHWKALETYIDREKLYDAATAAPSTPMRGTGAPLTPTGAPIQSSPIRASYTTKIKAKLADLPRYKNRIVDAIKANQAKRGRALSGVLEAKWACGGLSCLGYILQPGGSMAL